MNQFQEMENEFEDKDLEVRLKRALARVDAPAGFADRVMVRAAGQQKPKAKVFVMAPRTRAWVSGAMAAVLALGVFVGEQVHVRRERERANQEFETATRITDQAMAHARQQLERAGVPLE